MTVLVIGALLGGMQVFGRQEGKEDQEIRDQNAMILDSVSQALLPPGCEKKICNGFPNPQETLAVSQGARSLESNFAYLFEGPSCASCGMLN